MQDKSNASTYYYPDFIDFLDVELEGYVNENKKTKELISKLLFFPQPHYKNKEALSISTSYLRELGSTEYLFNKVNNKYQFFVVDKSYSVGRFSRRMFPNPIVTQLLHKFAMSPERVKLKAISKDGENKTIEWFPQVHDKIQVVGGLNIQGTFHINLEGLKAFIDDTNNKQHHVDQAFKWYRLARTDSLELGEVPQVYRQSENGRVTGYGMTIQNTARPLRKAMMQDYYDYDFKNCHYTILNHYGNYGAINGYVEHTDEVRDMLSKDLGVDKDSVKLCILAMLYGAGDGKHEKHCAVASYLGAEKVDSFWNHTFIKNLQKDTIRAGKELMNDDEFSFKALSNKLMNMEHAILKAVCEDKVIAVPMYDGYMSKEKYNLNDMETVIKQKLGYNITMTIKG